MISVAEAQELIRLHVVPLPPETVTMDDVHGRVLREPVAATEDMPAFDRSAMDGFAIGAKDDSHEFEVVGEIRIHLPGKISLTRRRASSIPSRNSAITAASPSNSLRKAVICASLSCCPSA